MAWFLASYARTAKAKVEEQELPALASLRSALEEALGLKFEGAKGDHFFRSTLVQPLFYGIFSAWVLWCKDRPLTSKETFNWHEAAWTLRVPMIRAKKGSSVCWLSPRENQTWGSSLIATPFFFGAPKWAVSAV